MVEIFNYAGSVYERYTLNEQIINDFRQNIKLEGHAVRDIGKHAQILNLVPKPSAISTLLGTNQKIRWARFETPPNYYNQRVRSPYLAPSLGAPEQQDRDMDKITAFLKILTDNQFKYSSKIKPLLFSRFRDSENNEESEEQQDAEEEENPQSLRVKEGRVILRVLDFGLKSTNVMIDYVISRMFQFVQG